MKVLNCHVSAHGLVKGGLKSNCFTFETLVRSTGVLMKFLALKSVSFYLQAQKSFEISKNDDWQQHTYWKYARQTFLPLCGLTAFLCAEINSPADVTDQTSTQSPVISTVD